MAHAAENLSTYLITNLKEGSLSCVKDSYTAMQTLIFATNNNHKVQEINAIIGTSYHIISLKEAGIDIDIPEPFHTLEENAKIKCDTIFRLTGKNCFSEDTGIEVEALNGEPGAKSARYAGEKRDDTSNIEQLLTKLRGSANRKARFRTIIALMFEGTEYLFEGICAGSIVNSPRGVGGFGYDPVFVPDGAQRTFAEMNMTEKNEYSHRKKAAGELINFLSHSWKKTSRF